VAALDVPEANAAAAISCLFGTTFRRRTPAVAPLTELTEDELVALATPVLNQLLEPER